MSLRHLLPSLVLLALATPSSRAADALVDDDLKIKGVFDSNLPGTERKHTLRIILHPRLGDLHRYNYMRVPMGLRYGLNNQWEVLGEVEGYFAHGLGDANWFSEAGFSDLHLGTKYRLARPVFGWDAAVGTDYSRTLGAPPPEITDGLNHLNTYATFSRRLESRPQWRIFWNIGTDFVEEAGVPGRVRNNRLNEDSLYASGGFVWEHGRWTYTIEAGLASTRPFGGDDDVFSFKPGILFAVPRKYTERIGGQWLLGFGLHSSYGSDGVDIGGTMKARVSIDFKRWLRQRRANR